MPIEPGATYVFDLGYYHFAWWARLDRAGCRFVTRVKRHTAIAPVRELALPKGSSLLYDRIGHLPQRMKASRTPPFHDPVREIGVLTETGKPLRILTNDLDAPALIAYLPLHLAKTSARLTSSPLAFARLVRANLMHRRDLDRLERPPPPFLNTQQLTFDWSPA